MPEVGDRIQVVGTKVEQATRSGVVTDVRGRMITVQWATGNQTVFVPAPGTLTVLGHAVTRPGRTNVSARKAPVRKTTKKRTAKKATRKAPVRKTTKKRTAKKAARARVR